MSDGLSVRRAPVHTLDAAHRETGSTGIVRIARDRPMMQVSEVRTYWRHVADGFLAAHTAGSRMGMANIELSPEQLNAAADSLRRAAMLLERGPRMSLTDMVVVIVADLSPELRPSVKSALSLTGISTESTLEILSRIHGTLVQQKGEPKDMLNVRALMDIIRHTPQGAMKMPAAMAAAHRY
jgi:hypothetical protein